MLRLIFGSILALFAIFSGVSGQNASWKTVAISEPVAMVAFDWQDGIFAISPQGEALYRPARGTTAWEKILPHVKAKFISVDPNGTVNVIPTSGNIGYFRVNGKWIQRSGTGVEQIVTTRAGKTFLRMTDGSVPKSGPAANNVKGKFQYISAASNSDSLYLVGSDNKIYITENGSTYSEIAGNGLGKMAVGTGIGVRGGQFILGVGSDANVYFFEVTPVNKWSKIPGTMFMKQILMSPKGVLYGVSPDNKLYYLDGKF